MKKKNLEAERGGVGSRWMRTHTSVSLCFNFPRTVPASEALFLVFFYWQLKRPFPNQKDWFDYYYYILYKKNIRSKRKKKNMSGWDRVRVSRLGTRMGRNRDNYSTLNERGPSTRTRTVRLGHVTPQAPGHRTIYCNDREANQPVRFKVWRILPFFFFLIRLCLVAEKILRKVESLCGWRIVDFDCVIAYTVFDDGQNRDSNSLGGGGGKWKDFIYLLCKLVLTKYEHWNC